MIKAQFETLTPGSGASFLVNSFALEKFTAPYHFHPEYELTWIKQGTGTRFVGKNMQAYGPGDLVFLGADLPHCWKSEDFAGGELRSQSVVIQFEHAFLGNEFFEKPELRSIAGLIKRGASGVRFLGATVGEAAGRMEALSREESSFSRMLRLLEILDLLARSAEYILLDHDGTTARSHPAERERLNISLGYIVDNFRTEISLDEVAATVNMSVSAFCKYFRKATGKTFIETVTDYRIHFATKQLLLTDKSMTDIAFESGFGDISHFYKVFRRRLKTSPLRYRRSFLELSPRDHTTGMV